MENRDKRQNTSKENAKNSTGPRTEKGKARSAQNATSHGAYSTKLLLPGEDENELNRLIQNHIHRFQPTDEIERTIVLQMAGILWRSFRVAAAENSLLNIQMHRMLPAINAEFTSVATEDLMALASAALHAEGQGPNHLTRLEARLQRQYHRLMRQLIQMREHFPAAPPVQHPEKHPETQPQPAPPPENQQREQTNLTPSPTFNPTAEIFNCLPPVKAVRPPATEEGAPPKTHNAAA